MINPKLMERAKALLLELEDEGWTRREIITIGTGLQNCALVQISNKMMGAT